LSLCPDSFQDKAEMMGVTSQSSHWELTPGKRCAKYA